MKLDFAKRIIYRKKSERVHFWIKVMCPFVLGLLVYEYKQRTKYNPGEKPEDMSTLSVFEIVSPIIMQFKAGLEMMKEIYFDKTTTLEELEEKHEIKVEELRQKVYDFPEVLAELKGMKIPKSVDEITLDDVLSGKVKELNDDEEEAYRKTLSRPPRV